MVINLSASLSMVGTQCYFKVLVLRTCSLFNI